MSQLDVKIDTDDIVVFSIVFLAIIVIDMIAMTLLLGPMNSAVVADVQDAPPALRRLPGILAYALLALGVYFFVLRSTVDASGRLNPDLRAAALLGLVIFGTYNMVNLTLFDDYSYVVSVIDTAWGMALLSGSTYVATMLYNDGLPSVSSVVESRS